MTAKPYVDPVTSVSQIIALHPCARTDMPLTSQYGAFHIITNRIGDFQEVLENLPCIVIDLLSDSMDYYYTDQQAWRLIPMTIVLYIPCMTRGLTADAAIAVDQEADIEIKTLFADLEEVLSSGKAMSSVANELFLTGGGGIFYDTFEWEDSLGARMRVAQLNVVVRSLIR